MPVSFAYRVPAVHAEHYVVHIVILVAVVWNLLVTAFAPFARLIIEDVTSVMSKNLVTLLDVMERQHVDIRTLMEENGARLKKLEARMDAGEHERADLRLRLARIETVLAERPADREREHQAILDAITQAHAEPLNDDGHDGP